MRENKVSNLHRLGTQIICRNISRINHHRFSLGHRPIFHLWVMMMLMSFLRLDFAPSSRYARSNISNPTQWSTTASQVEAQHLPGRPEIFALGETHKSSWWRFCDVRCYSFRMCCSKKVVQRKIRKRELPNILPNFSCLSRCFFNVSLSRLMISSSQSTQLDSSPSCRGKRWWCNLLVNSFLPRKMWGMMHFQNPKKKKNSEVSHEFPRFQRRSQQLTPGEKRRCKPCTPALLSAEEKRRGEKRLRR